MTTEALQVAQPTIRGRVAVYGELAKVRISAMVGITAAAGFYLAPVEPDAARGVATVLGTMLLSAGAGALNQVVEGELDAKMRRTERRPIPTKRISEAEAIAFALALAVGGLALLIGFVNFLTAALAGGCLLFYVGVYTPLKTRTTWNTFAGAVAGALPPLLGWTGATGRFAPMGWILFGILFLWQFPHFFAIAHMYRDDYAAAGHRMLPVVDERGVNTGIQTIATTAGLIAVTLTPYFLGLAGALYFAGAIGFGALFLYITVRMVRSRGARAEARRVLLASVIYLPGVLGLLVFDKFARGVI